MLSKDKAKAKCMKDLEEIKAKVAEFASERDWDKFHSPKNLAMALSVEVAELVETFQWLTEAESSSLSIAQLTAVTHEIADVQVYLVRLADKVGIDILHAVEEKMRLSSSASFASHARSPSSSMSFPQSMSRSQRFDSRASFRHTLIR